MPPGHPRWSATGWVWLARVGYTPPAAYCIGADDYGRKDACAGLCGYRFDCRALAAELDAEGARLTSPHLRPYTHPAESADRSPVPAARDALGVAEVVAIREAVATGARRFAVAVAYRISSTAVSRIAAGLTYTQIGGPRTPQLKPGRGLRRVRAAEVG